MMTSGDIEFEPRLESGSVDFMGMRSFSPNPKIFTVSSSIVIMTAGDSGLQAEVMGDAQVEISARINRDPDKWLPVKEAVDCYINAYNSAKGKRVVNDILAPFGLDSASFLSRQSDLATEFVLDINRRILNSDLDFRELHQVEAIVTGIDDMGPHIYTVFGDFVTCCDSIGFAAIGIGARHAESQFMMAGHGPYSNREETLLLTYLAKKRSKVAPGVGHETDMFVADSVGNISMLDSITDFSISEIDAIYQTMEKEQARRFNSAKEKTKKYIAKMFAARAKRPPQQEADQQSQQGPQKAAALESGGDSAPADSSQS